MAEARILVCRAEGSENGGGSQGLWKPTYPAASLSGRRGRHRHEVSSHHLILPFPHPSCKSILLSKASGYDAVCMSAPFCNLLEPKRSITCCSWAGRSSKAPSTSCAACARGVQLQSRGLLHSSRSSERWVSSALWAYATMALLVAQPRFLSLKASQAVCLPIDIDRTASLTHSPAVCLEVAVHGSRHRSAMLGHPTPLCFCTCLTSSQSHCLQTYIHE